jgi:hypothetical protein
MGPCVVNVFLSIINKIQRYTIHLFLQNALHVSGGCSAHHQELKTVHTAAFFFFFKILLLPAAVVEELEQLFHDSGKQ